MRRLSLALSFLLLAAAFEAAEARDVALVIGNDNYANIPVLQKAVNDAGSMAAELEKLGFVVRRAENLDQRSMSRALVAFDADIGPGDRAFFFYSGHGFEIDGTNYLLPIDVPAAAANPSTDLIRDASFPVSQIIDGIRERGASVAVLVLDACRDSPFDTMGRGLPATRGLARVDAPDGVFVLMSAGAKQEALDRLSDADADPELHLHAHLPARTAKARPDARPDRQAHPGRGEAARRHRRPRADPGLLRPGDRRRGAATPGRDRRR